ncbi:hypothetical protein DFS34DRAFT_591720 [Phlyctochytrium arcticum]|nr:hypothetical protein DFS34DRAFT_591720 [Phlyctochytrium arcticum]
MSTSSSARKGTTQVEDEKNPIGSPNWRRSTVVEEEKISDLAKSSTHQEKKSWFPAIRLLILAPLLVLIALAGVIVPNSIILSGASGESVGYLGNKYVNVVLTDIKVKVEKSIIQTFPIVSYVARWDKVRTAMTTNFENLENESDIIPQLVAIKEEYGLDTIGCYQCRWKPGFESSPTANATSTRCSSMYLQLSPQTNTGTVLSIGRESVDTLVQFYTLNSTSERMRVGLNDYLKHDTLNTLAWMPDSATPFLTQTGNSYYNYAARSALGLVTPKTLPYFTLYNNTGTKVQVAFVSKSAFVPNEPKNKYACSAGYRIDNSWNAILLAARPTDTAVVALFEPTKLAIAASSDMVLNGTGITIVNGTATYDVAEPKELTLALQASIIRKFGTFANISKSTEFFYSDSILGNVDWVLRTAYFSFTVASISSYPAEKVLLVAAIPRYEIYGTIDAARLRSIRTSIGISVAMAVLISLVYIAVVLPLMNLAKAMKTLTKLDFGTLEESNMLNERSWIWELRNVQITFATMVKAFAGAIKKNKVFVQRTMMSSGAQSRDSGEV